MNGDSLPAKSTAETRKSNLNKLWRENSAQRFDLLDSNQFPDFNKFIKEYFLTLIRHGKGKVKHRRPVNKDDLKAIFEIGKVLHGLINGNPDDKEWTWELNGTKKTYNELLLEFRKMMPDYTKGNKKTVFFPFFFFFFQ